MWNLCEISENSTERFSVMMWINFLMRIEWKCVKRNISTPIFVDNIRWSQFDCKKIDVSCLTSIFDLRIWKWKSSTQNIGSDLQVMMTLFNTSIQTRALLVQSSGNVAGVTYSYALCCRNFLAKSDPQPVNRPTKGCQRQFILLCLLFFRSQNSPMEISCWQSFKSKHNDLNSSV